ARTTSISISPTPPTTRSGGSRTPADGCPSPARSRWPCVTACRRASKRSTTGVPWVTGTPRIQQAPDAGIRPSLSSDVETTMAADMFTQMRSVFTLQRALLNDRSIRGEKDLPPLLNARDVIEFATLQGARADGMEAKVGTLT